MVTVERVLQAVRDFCPPRFAVEGDATGLQVGQGDRRIEKVLTTLDLTLAVAEEARDLGVGLIVSHHALIFRPLRHLRTDDFKVAILELLIKNEIAVYVPHTALDVVDAGMNDHLAAAVGLSDTRYLEETGRDGMSLVSAEPRDLDAALALAHSRGALRVRRDGGRGEALIDSRRAGKLAAKLADLCDAEPWHTSLDAPHAARGIGRVGNLAEPESLSALATRLKTTLGAPGVRLVANDPDAKVERVAVLGGDGRRYLRAALRAGAGALVTGDVDHHTALEAKARGLALIDVGHFASERQVSPLLANAIRDRLNIEDVQVLESSIDTQPFRFF
jgi:dinuclear metal center YbgI/SA1388 family protein